MNWKRSVCLLGAVLMCTSLLVAADKPPATMQQAMKAASPAQAATLAGEGMTAEVRKLVKPMKVQKTVTSLPAHSGASLKSLRGGPANDMCADAIAIGDVTDYAFDTTDATMDDPNNTHLIGADIWYCYTATCDGDVTVSLCGSTYDTKVAAFAGCDCAGVPANEVAYNDDFCSLQSQITFDAVTGDEFLIQVGGYDGAFGAGIMNISCAPAGEVPENDDCADAEPIGEVTDYPFDTTAASFDGVGTCMTSANVWYCYTASCTADVIVDLCGSTFDTKLAVYDGCVCDPLTLIECNDDSAYCDGRSLQSSITFAAVAGNQYLIEVGGYDVNVGPGDISITCMAPVTGACCDDMQNCIATNTEPECDVLGGRWYEGEDCATFVCPVPIPGDDCDTAFAVTTYPYTDSNGPGGGPDCPELLDEWYAMWYALDLPYATNQIEITLCATGLYNSGIVIMDDCACDDYINDTGYVFEGDCITVHFRVDGPSTWYFPAIAEDELGGLLPYDITINVTEVQDCVIDCTDNEGEGDCYEGYDDTYNGGCNTSPMVFQPIACGDTICGSTGVFYLTTSYYRDMDWFTITLTEPKTLTWGGMSELPLALWIVTEDCSAAVTSGTTAYGCEELYISATLEPGTYYPLISVPGWEPSWACGSKYEVSLTCTDPVGACCVDGNCAATNTLGECDGLGGDWFIGENCSTFTCPSICSEATIGITITTDDWPSETTWVVQENGTGTVVGSGGPYAAATTYYANVCVPYGGCWDFIIYDAYGDGIFSPGGYTVTFEGTVVADTMGGLFTGSQDNVEFFGDGCVYPPGACCDGALNCIATNTEPECDALGGRFFEGESCPAFVCPDADFIETAPFTTPVRSTCGEGDDCAMASCAYNDTEEVTYRITIPYDALWAFDLCGSSYDTLLTVGTTECSDDLGCNDDACSVQSFLSLPLTAGDYYVAVEGYSSCGDYILDVYEDRPCDYTCPANGYVEGEPDCYDNYDDMYNGGCNASPEVFQYIDCDEIICGKNGTFTYGTGTYRDTDWYEFTLDGGINQIEMTVCANFGWTAYIIEGPCPGTILQEAEGDAYDEGTVSGVLQAGTYYMWIGATSAGTPCGTSEYLATISGLGDCICGDFTGPEDPAGSGEFPPDGVVDELDFYFFLDAYGTCDGDLKYQAACDFDEDNCITALDYQAWIACYRDANGKRFVNPAFQSLRRGTSGGRLVAP